MLYDLHCNITTIQQLFIDINREISTLRNIVIDNKDACTTSYTRDIASAVGANSIKVYYTTTSESSNHYILHVDILSANIKVHR